MKRVLHISLLAILGLLLFQPASAQVAVGISVSFGPPALPVYEQPMCPEDGWMWVPGYWAWDADDNDYYWVPGTWVAAPEPGYLWTPAWWGWEGGFYRFHEGYWGTEVGFYGGISYGFGYWGHGFWGGRWEGGRFMYNTAVVNVNRTVIRNVYIDKTVIVNNNVHTSYNGGEGGVEARPTEQEQRAESQRHIPPVAEQTRHDHEARGNPQMRASANQGKPPVAATEKPGEFSGHGAVQAKSAGEPYHPPANRQQNARPENENQHPANENAKPGENNAAPTHARELQPHQAPAAPEGGSAADKKAQQQQEKLIQKQNQEHEKLAQQQEKEDQQAKQKNYNAQKQQQMEQKHQQQTQQMEQRHAQQQQKAQPKPKPQPKPKEPRE